MDLSKKWLADYVDLDVEDREFAEAITISGSKVESYKQEGEELKNIVVGHLLSLKNMRTPTSSGSARSMSGAMHRSRSSRPRRT